MSWGSSWRPRTWEDSYEWLPRPIWEVMRDEPPAPSAVAVVDRWAATEADLELRAARMDAIDRQCSLLNVSREDAIAYLDRAVGEYRPRLAHLSEAEQSRACAGYVRAFVEALQSIVLTESVATVDGAVHVLEAATVAPTATPNRYVARLIQPGWGSSGFYSEAMLRRDAAGPGSVFGVGTHVYADHPTASEEAERPVRSIKDLAGQIVSTPVYEGDGVYAEVEVFPTWAPAIAAMKDSIGMSIRASGMAEYGEAAGRSGMIITSLDHGDSVDFVTKAGAGGRLVRPVGA